MDIEKLSPAAEMLVGKPQRDAQETDTDVEDLPDQEIDSSASEAGDSEQPVADTGQGENPEPMTVKALAEKLGTSPKALYDNLKIGDLSLGQIKDRIKDLENYDALVNEVTDRRVDVENQLNAEWEKLKLAQAMPDKSPEVRKQLYSQYVSDQTDKAINAIPGWKDTAIRTAEVGEITALMREFGKSDIEIAHVIDAVDIRAWHELNRLRKRFKAAGESSVKAAPKSQGQGNRQVQTKPPGKVAIDRYKAGQISQIDAVTALIADGAKRNEYRKP